jgi:hypothetical protein
MKRDETGKKIICKKEMKNEKNNGKRVCQEMFRPIDLCRTQDMDSNKQ